MNRPQSKFTGSLTTSIPDRLRQSVVATCRSEGLKLAAMFGMILSGIILASDPAHGGVVFGGFDASRGGDFSLSDGSAASGLRSLITTDFAGSTITGSSTLTSSYLSSINVLVIDSVYYGNDVPITGLSSSEQAALLAFVEGGGSAILISDNGVYGPPANTYNNLFGVTATGFLGGSVPGTITNQTSPVTNGPFGVVNNFVGSYAGYFSDLGPYAESLGTYNSNGQAGVAVINRGVISAGSGAVVFFSDSFPIDNLAAGDNRTLTLNSLAFVSSVPEPSSLILLGLGVLGVVAVRRSQLARSSSAAH